MCKMDVPKIYKNVRMTKEIINIRFNNLQALWMRLKLIYPQQPQPMLLVKLKLGLGQKTVQLQQNVRPAVQLAAKHKFPQ
jgi:hypothetical protein